VNSGVQECRQPGIKTDAKALSVTVVIPTYLRPRWLVGCMKSLVAQTRCPDEVIAVMRDDDGPTHEAFVAFGQSCDLRGIAFRVAIVTQPGFLPPLAAGIKAANSDIVAFIDDDAEACSDWLERLLAPYADPLIAGVGGRYVNIYDGAEAKYPRAARVGRFHWWGVFEGNMYRDLPSQEPRYVDFFMGGNMSYRHEALRDVVLDPALEHDVAFHYEVDLGAQVKKSAGHLVYDPLARIHHYSAPRAQAGLRRPDRDAIFWYSHNTLYIAMKHALAPKRWLAVAYSFVVGSSRAWGLVVAIVSVVRDRNLQPFRQLRAAFGGKIRAIRSYRAFARRAVAA
jgi:GT2 family glycosyltransferase